jgi:hypothetical protein
VEVLVVLHQQLSILLLPVVEVEQVELVMVGRAAAVLAVIAQHLVLLFLLVLQLQLL